MIKKFNLIQSLVNSVYKFLCINGQILTNALTKGSTIVAIALVVKILMDLTSVPQLKIPDFP